MKVTIEPIDKKIKIDPPLDINHPLLDNRTKKLLENSLKIATSINNETKYYIMLGLLEKENITVKQLSDIIQKRYKISYKSIAKNINFLVEDKMLIEARQIFTRGQQKLIKINPVYKGFIKNKDIMQQIKNIINKK